LEVFADDVVGMHNTLPPLVGKDAVRQFGEMVAENLNIEQMDIVVDEVRVNGSWALTRGSFTSKFVPKSVTDSSAIKPGLGKFILLWERQSDGVWKVILDMGNSSESLIPPS
jgi:ketosteroid isomerase-like protein